LTDEHFNEIRCQASPWLRRDQKIELGFDQVKKID